MRIGILDLYTGNCNNIGYYNVQEIGLIRQLIKNEDVEAIFFKLVDKNKLGCIREEYLDDGIRIVYIPANTFKLQVWFNYKILNNYSIDILQIGTDTQFISKYIIKWALNNGIKVISYIGVIETDSKNIIKKILINKFVFNNNKRELNKIINVCKTSAVYERLQEEKIKKKYMIPVGLDTTLLYSDYSRYSKVEIRKLLKLKESYKIILFIGRLSEEKNPIIALELFVYLKNMDSNYHMIFIGDGKLKNEFFNKVQELNLIDSITYIEKVLNEDIWKYYRASDVFINLNKNEVFGMCILESMYYECPIIAVKAPGPSFILSNGIDSFLINNFDKREWESRIRDIISNNDFIKIAKEKVNNSFTWEAIGRQFYNLYKNL